MRAVATAIFVAFVATGLPQQAPLPTGPIGRASTAVSAGAPPRLAYVIEVAGEAFLRFSRDARVIYARQAEVVVVDGVLAHRDGWRTVPTISVPDDALALEFEDDGRVWAVTASGRKACGRIALARFAPQTSFEESEGMLVAAVRPEIVFPGETVGERIYARPMPRVAGSVASRSPGGAVSTPPRIASGPTSNPGRGHVRLSWGSEAEVDGGPVRLASILTIDAEPELASRIGQLEIGMAPAFTSPYSVTRERVVQRVVSIGVPADRIEWNGPRSITLKRRSQRVTSEMFAQAALAAVRARVGNEASLSLPDAGSGDYLAPVGKLELPVESLDPGPSGWTARVAVVVDGKRLNSRIVRIVGSVAEIGVRSGSIVKVRIAAGGATAEVLGRVRSNALVGASVEVTVDMGGGPTSLTGTVIGPGLVEVKL